MSARWTTGPPTIKVSLTEGRVGPLTVLATAEFYRWYSAHFIKIGTTTMPLDSPGQQLGKALLLWTCYNLSHHGRHADVSSEKDEKGCTWKARAFTTPLGALYVSSSSDDHNPVAVWKRTVDHSNYLVGTAGKLFAEGSLDQIMGVPGA